MGWPSYRWSHPFFPVEWIRDTRCRETRPGRVLEHAVQERGALPQQDRDAALQIRRGAKLAHDDRAVSQDVFGRDDTRDRHRPLLASPRRGSAMFMPWRPTA